MNECEYCDGSGRVKIAIPFEEVTKEFPGWTSRYNVVEVRCFCSFDEEKGEE